jgi:hypothetical protein
MMAHLIIANFRERRRLHVCNKLISAVQYLSRS